MSTRSLSLAALLLACSSEPEGSVDELDSATTDSSMAEVSDNDTGATETSNPMDSAMMIDTAMVMDTAPASAPHVYVGCSSGQIQLFTFDVAAGELTNKAWYAGGNNPSFLAWTGSYLFAVNEGSNEVQAFSITKGTGALMFLNKVGSSGGGPAFVSVDGSGKHALVANYGGGTVAVFPIGADGKLGMKSSGDAPGPKAHAILADPTNKFVFAPVLGADAVFQYTFNSTTGTITPNGKASTASGAGPRHIAFHPTQPYAFVVNELNSTIQAFKIESSGTLTSQQTMSTLPMGFTGGNTGADIHVHPNGKFVYTSNRGHNSIAMFSIDATGKVASIGHEPTGGNTPRNFHIDPTGQIMLVANQGSSNVVTFRIGTDGKLTKIKTFTTMGPPSFVGVVSVPL
jgi:6-phosphogluconolactonase